VEALYASNIDNSPDSRLVLSTKISHSFSTCVNPWFLLTTPNAKYIIQKKSSDRQNMVAEESIQNIGVIGLGRMGTAIASNKKSTGNAPQTILYYLLCTFTKI
jgi:hypothetical protein